MSTNLLAFVDDVGPEKFNGQWNAHWYAFFAKYYSDVTYPRPDVTAFFVWYKASRARPGPTKADDESR